MRDNVDTSNRRVAALSLRTLCTHRARIILGKTLTRVLLTRGREDRNQNHTARLRQAGNLDNKMQIAHQRELLPVS